jgi:serine/threonine-protein kinase
MKRPSAKLSSFHADIFNQTHLGQICGSQRLFRDRYEILRILGRGGFGVTFLAKDVSLPSHPLCVIKQLCPKVSDPIIIARARKRFEQEAKTLSDLGSHSQVPTLLNYFEAEGEFYLVQEYIKGPTLTAEIRRSGPASEAKVKQFLREILPVLQYIHSHQVIHRDIKPPNIIRSEDDGRLVLIDFGAVKEQIAQFAGETTSQKAPTTQFVGTVGFAPPEQLSLRPIYGSDIYAVGVTCIYLLTGESPLNFDYDSTTGEICWRDSAQVSDYFAKVLDRMIKISPQERYQSAEEVLRILNLEPHLDSLNHCMSAQPPSLASFDDNPEEVDLGQYLSPTARTAIAIRQWKAKLQTNKLHRESIKIKGLLGGSGYAG